MLKILISDGVWLGTFYDGPDGIDEFEFSGNSLGECFEKVIAFQTLNSFQYPSEKTEAKSKP